jgi:hypothetical protein
LSFSGADFLCTFCLCHFVPLNPKKRTQYQVRGNLPANE